MHPPSPKLRRAGTFTLPSGVEIDLVEMTGVEEDLLTNRRLMKNGEAINQVLLNCTKCFIARGVPDAAMLRAGSCVPRRVAQRRRGAETPRLQVTQQRDDAARC